MLGSGGIFGNPQPMPWDKPDVFDRLGGRDPVVEALIGSQPAQSYMSEPPAVSAGVATPFVWGEGGAKLSPEQVAMLRARGESMSQSDYSPVGHWTQGLGRVVDNIRGALDVKRAERMEGENRDYQARMAEALASGNVDDATIARVLMDPNASQGAQGYAGMLMQARTPKQVAPTELEKLMLASGMQPGSPEWNAQIEAELLNRRDPFTTFTGPTVGYTGRQSGLAAALGGGGQTSGVAPSGAPPAGAVVDGYRFKGGDPNDQSNWEEVGGTAGNGGGSF